MARRNDFDLVRLLVLGFVVAALCLAASFWLTRGVLAGELDALDRRVLAWMEQHRSAWLTDAMLEVTSLGGLVVITLLGVTAVLYAFAVRRRGLGILFVLVFSGAGLLNFSYKQLVGRPRPTEFFAERAAAHSPSFPSGHSLMAAVVYLTCGFLLWGIAPTRAARLVVAATAVALTVAVGTSRVYLGVHHPSDVLAGWTTGAAWALSCYSSYRWWARRRGRRGALATRTEAS